MGGCGAGGRDLQRQKGGILSVIIYREQPPTCSVTLSLSTAQAPSLETWTAFKEQKHSRSKPVRLLSLSQKRPHSCSSFSRDTSSGSIHGRSPATPRSTWKRHPRSQTVEVPSSNFFEMGPTMGIAEPPYQVWNAYLGFLLLKKKKNPALVNFLNL